MAKKSKNGNGEGTIYYSEARQRWIGQVTTGRTETGKLRRHTLYGKTKKEVREKIVALQSEVFTGQYIEPSSITVHDYIKRLIDDDLSLNIISAASYKRKITHLKIIDRYPISNKSLSDVTEKHINEILIGISTYSDSVINKVVSLLRRCFREASRNGLIRKNIMDGRRKPKSQKQSVKVRALTLGEEKNLLDFFRQNDVKYSTMYILMLMTGMRMGEICALDIDDVNLNFKVITVRRTATLDSADQPIVGQTTKTRAGMRKIPITDQLLPLLKNFISQYEPNREHLLFWDYDSDTMIYTSRLNMALKRLLNDNSILDPTVPGKVSLHSLRHTYATRCIESGMPPKILQTLLGHTDIKTTLNTYCDAFDDYQYKHIDVMQEYLTEKGLIV